MENIKIIIGIGIIIASFVYILRNKGTMLDNMMKKTKEEYEKKQAIKEKAYNVVDGKADAFDTVIEGVRGIVNKGETPAYENVSDDNKQ